MQKHLEVFNQLVADFTVYRRTSTGPATLILAEDKIKIQPVPFDKRNKLHLIKLPEISIKHGLTSSEWAYIAGIVRQHFSRKEITGESHENQNKG